MLYDNLNVNEKGHLSFAGYDTAELAEKYPLPRAGIQIGV